MPTSNIKCGEFCPYNKKLFCPFYNEVQNFPKIEQKPEVIPNKIKTKKYSIKPVSKSKKKKNNSSNGGNSDNSNNIDVWMTFTGGISNSIFTANFNGKMTDLKLGEFSGFATPTDDDNFSSLSFIGKISTSDKTCDFGGEIELNITIKDKENNTSNQLLSGKFITFYESGGTTITPEEENETQNDEEEISMKFYDGKVDFNNNIFDGNINFYTDM